MMGIALFISIAVLTLILLIVRRPIIAFFRGKKGELSVRMWLKLLSSDQYKIINDLLISSHGHTSQIDHVVVSEYGIFVIETKNYSGWIYGSANSDQWTQNIYGDKYQLYNPILQNQGHIRALRNLLKDIPSGFFISIVAFSRNATLKNQYLNNVVYWNQINDLIRSYEQKRLSSEQVQRVYNTLLSANIDSKDARKQHIQNVRGQIYRNDVSVAHNRCPRCGGRLVLRDGKYGDFYGCSNYPRCRFTRQP